MPRSKRDVLGLGPMPKKRNTRSLESKKSKKSETRSPKPKMVKVNIIESERGWGQKIDEVKEFATMELAEAFVTEFNSRNTEHAVPDWYMRAEVVR